VVNNESCTKVPAPESALATQNSVSLVINGEKLLPTANAATADPLSTEQAKDILFSDLMEKTPTTEQKQYSTLTATEAKEKLIGGGFTTLVDDKEASVAQKTADKQQAISGSVETGPSRFGIPYELLSPENKAAALKEAQLEQDRLSQDIRRSERESRQLISDADLDTVPGYIANLGLNVLSGAATVGADILKAPSHIANYLDTVGITDNDILLYNEVLRGGDLSTAAQEFAQSDKFSNLQDVKARGVFIDTIDSGLTTISGWINDNNTAPALAKLSDTTQKAEESFIKGDYARGIGHFLSGVADLAIEDTAAAGELLANTLPQMYVLARQALFGTSTLAISQYDQAIEEFQAEHGRVPNESEKAMAGVLSFVSAGLDTLGAKFVLRLKGSPNKILAIAEKTGVATAQVTLNAAKASLKTAAKQIKQTKKAQARAAAPLVKKTLREMKEIVKAGFVEGGTEGAQKALTDLAAKQDVSKLDVSDILTDAAVGAVIGKGIRGGQTAIKAPGAVATAAVPVVKAGLDALEKRGIGNNQKIIKRALEEEDAELGLGAISDIDIAALPEEQIEEHLDNYNTLLDMLDKEIDSTTDPAQKAKKQQIYIKNTKKLSNTIREQLREEKGKAFAEAVELLDPQERSTVDAEGRKVKSDLTSKLSPKVGKAAVVSLIDNIENSMDVTTPQIIRALGSESFDEHATKEQKRKAKDFKKLRESEDAVDAHMDVSVKGIQDVHEEVRNGKGKFKGVNQHVTDFQRALGIKDNAKAKAKATQTIEHLQALGRSQKNKLAQKGFTTDDGRFIKHTAEFVEALNLEIALIRDTIRVLNNAGIDRFGFKKKSPGFAAAKAEPTKEAEPEKKKKVEPKTKAKEEVKPKPKEEKVEPKAKAAEPAVAPTVTPEGQVPLVTPDNVAEVLAALKAVPEDLKTVPVQNAINTLETAPKNMEAGHGRIVNVNRAIKVLNNAIAGITVAKPGQVQGVHDPEVDQGSTAKNILQDNVPYETGTKADRAVPIDERTTLEDILEVDPNPKTTSVLQKIHNFFSLVTSKEDSAAKKEARKSFPKLTKAQKDAFPTLIAFNRRFKEILLGTKEGEGIINNLKSDLINKSQIDGVIDETGEAELVNENFGDPSGYFIQRGKDGKKYINENLLSSMAMVVLDWIANEGQATLINDPESINIILGNPKEGTPSNDATKNLTNAGVPRNSLDETIGRAIFKQLGLKDKPGITGDMIPRIELALGKFAVSTMLHGDMAFQTSFTPAQISDMGGADTVTDIPDAIVHFVRIAGNPVPEQDNPYKLELSGPLAKIREVIRKSEDLLKTLFNIKEFATGPHLEPVKTVVKKIKNSPFALVPQPLRDAIKAYQKVEWEVKTNVVEAAEFLGRTQLENLYGYNRNVANEHISKRPGIEARNQAITKEIDDFLDLQESLENPDSVFYFEHEVFVNHRVGMASSTVNPQNSKLHRHFVGARAWNTEVNTQDGQLAFMMAALQAFGTKIENIVDEAEVNTKFNELISDPVIQKGITALRASQNTKNPLIGKQKTAARKAIMEAVKDREAVATLDGLTALASALDTDFTIKTSFETNLSIEVDGITNGIAIGLLQSRTDPNIREKLASASIYGDLMHTGIGSWKAAEPEVNLDNYEKLGTAWNRALGDLDPKNFSADDRIFMEQVLGSFKDTTEPDKVISTVGRKLAKDPLMTNGYGAGIKRIQSIIGDTALTNFYDRLMEAANAKENPQQKINELFKELSEFGKPRIKFPIKPPKVADAKNYMLEDAHPSIPISFQKRVNDTYGAALKIALEEELGNYRQFREKITNGFTAMWYIFEEKLNLELTKAEEAKNEDLKPGERRKSLSTEEVNTIMKGMLNFFPAVKTAMSQEFLDRLYILKTEQQREYQNPNAKVKVEHGVPINNTSDPRPGKNHGKPLASSTGTISKSVPVNNSTAGIVLMIQSLDSSIVAEIFGQYASLNIFDASMFKLDDAFKGTKDFNKAMQVIMDRYNMVTEVKKSLQNALSSLERAHPELVDVVEGKIMDDEFLERADIHSIEAILFDLEVLEKETIEARKIIKPANYNNYNLLGGRHESETSVKPKTAKKPTQAKQEQEDAKVATELASDAINNDYEEKYTSSREKPTVTRKFFIQLGKWGGISRASAAQEGIDPVIFKERIGGKFPLFPAKGGHSFDALAEWLNEQGHKIDGQDYDANDALDLVNDLLSAVPTRVPPGLEEEFLAEQIREHEEGPEGLGSIAQSNRSIDFENFNATYEQSLSGQNSTQIFDELGSINSKGKLVFGNVEETQERQTYLKDLLNNLVNKVISPLDKAPLEYDLKVNTEGDIVFGGIKEEKIRIQAGKGVIGNMSQISAQETLVHELIHAISQYGIDQNFTVRKQLLKLFNEVKEVITVQDFLRTDNQGNLITAVDPAAELKAAQDRMDYIFNTPNSLHEFVAFGLTNEQFGDILSRIERKTKRDTKQGTWKERLHNLYLNILDWIANKVQGTENMSADQALLKLTENLVGINTRNHINILKYLDKIHELNPKIVANFNKIIFDPLRKYNEKLVAKGDKLSIPGKVVRDITGIPIIAASALKSDEFQRTISQINRMIGFSEQNFLVKLARDAVGPTRKDTKWHNLLRTSKHLIDQARKQLSENVKKHLLDDFDPDRPLSQNEIVALNKVLLKADVEVLFDQYQLEDILKFLSKNSKELTAEINDIKSQLHTTYGDNGFFYTKQAQSLGSIMATGNALVDDPLLNAHIIAQMTTVDDVEATGDLEAAEVLIDRLATLQALSYTEQAHKTLAADVIKHEFERDPEINGAKTTVRIHRNYKVKALDSLFDGNKFNMVKGYTREIYNPAINFIVGKKSQEKEMAQQGYFPDHSITKDKHDTHEEKETVIYVSKVDALDPTIKGVTSLTSKQAKGTSLYDIYKNEGRNAANVDAVIATETVKKANQESTAQNMFNNVPLDPADTNNYLVPIVDTEGKITTYRYMMNEHTKDRVLEKNNNFAETLGDMEANIIDKVNSREINRRAMKLAHEEYLENSSREPSKYVVVGKNSPDPRYREIYQMMPQDMKDDVKEIWGEDNIEVREELIDLIFGYRKIALSDQKYVKMLSESSFGEFVRLDFHLKLAGDIWQEVVAMAKDYIVVKSFVVLKDNITSNNFVLYVKGVPLEDIAKNQAIALQALHDYQIEINERNILQRRLDTQSDLSDVAKSNIQNKLTRLNDNIRVNPIAELVDMGIFQNIVEDINIASNEENKFGYRKGILDKITPFTDKYVPETATDVAKQVVMTKDTFLYKKLLQGTQYSDFVARYALWQHNLNKIEKSHPDELKAYNKLVTSLSKATDVDQRKQIQVKIQANPVHKLRQDAILDIVETFINYDVPTSPEMQWLNDMGFLMFTKFLFRIQRVIGRTFRDNPASAMSMMALQEMMDVAYIDDSNLITSSMSGRMHTPYDIVKEATHMAGLELAIAPF